MVLRSKTTRAATTGFVAFGIGVGWTALHEYIATRHDPPGWIVDRVPYQPAAILSWIGLLIFLVASIFGIARWGNRRVHSTWQFLKAHRRANPKAANS